MVLEVLIHAYSLRIDRPTTALDAPFYTGCQSPILNTTARANATLFMLARNSDVDGAVESVRNVQEQFNNLFGYGWVFLNDEPWSTEFRDRVSEALGNATARTFGTINEDMWGYPSWIDQSRAKNAMGGMERNGVIYAGKESYHHMCRFQSGFFHDHPALASYRYYWRVEPSVRLTCRITYDPFIAMAKHKKRYGYTIALWERGKTVPSLFRKLSEYKASLQTHTTSLWRAMMAPSYMPWPFRGVMSWLRNRDENGDLWNMCHFWSNFEIADMDFFRAKEYRALFDFLDKDGGFYYERWGDAPIHSLGAAMLLKPEEVHHFSDIGYVHGGLQYCAIAPTAEAKRQGRLVPKTEEDRGDALGCECTCDDSIGQVNPECFNRIKSTVE